MAKLNVRAFGLACGIVGAAGSFLLGIFNMWTGWASGWMMIMGSAYIGYAPSFLGSIIGACWGFVDAGIGGLVLAWLYNKLAK